MQHANAVLLEVADNGKGIAHRQITDRTSLGILGMRERARLWGGYVTINSTPGVGTTVTIWVPREIASLEVGTGVTRVLVADDHATVREGIRRFLADTTDLLVTREAGTAPEVLALQRPLQNILIYHKGLRVRTTPLPFIACARKAPILCVQIWLAH